MTEVSYQIPTNIPKTIFRAYDIRGIVGDSFNEDLVYAIGLAVGTEVQNAGEQTIVAGRDSRLSGPILMPALIKGLRDSGCNVIDIGEAPTPLVYFATHNLETQSGVVLTGSHNPAEYNGIKIIIDAESLSGGQIESIYQRIVSRDFSSGEGSYTTYNMLPEYLMHVNDHIDIQKPLKVVVDCGNGVAGRIAPALLRLLGAEVSELYCEVDGTFPNHHPDPSLEENLRDLVAAVIYQKADLGVAFDGDGDRIGVVDSDGNIIWPDRQLMVFAEDVLSRNPGSSVIFDVKCTRHLAEHIKEMGGNPIMWKTGHSLIKSKMRETGALVAGEMSGHIFFKERWYGYDDAIYAAARLLEVLSKQECSSAEYFQQFPDSLITPEIKLSVTDERKFDLMEQLLEQATFDGGQVNRIDGLRVDFEDGWGLIRPSNTTPNLVLRFEAENETVMERIKALFREQLLTLDESLVLPF